MKTLLRIDASTRKHGSYSRELADYFQARWTQAHHESHVVRRDLADDPVPHIDNSTIAEFQAADNGGSDTSSDATTLSDTLIAELQSADQVLVSSPLYNFNVPSPLKAYIDHVVRSGHTFSQNGHGHVGLLSGKSACIITAQGGIRSVSEVDGLDFQGPYLTAIFDFIGFDRIDLISLDGTSEDDGRVVDNVARAYAEIDRLPGLTQAMHDEVQIEWIGTFTSLDREGIAALRAGQISSIEHGDADAYARLCTEDVLLMLQGYDVVAGLRQFIERESALFRSTQFDSIRQIPLRVERQADLAVEVGRQEIVVASGSSPLKDFKTQRKYTHVLRKTPEGWRFAVLMSNNSM